LKSLPRFGGGDRGMFFLAPLPGGAGGGFFKISAHEKGLLRHGAFAPLLAMTVLFRE